MIELKANVKDLFCHMELLGLAQILRHDEDACGLVTLRWDSPEKMSIGCADPDFGMDGLAKSVWKYKEIACSHREVVDQVIDVSVGDNGHKQAHSPISPRIAKSLSDAEFDSYYRKREDIVDAAGVDDPLLAELVGALGGPSYWGTTKQRPARGREATSRRKPKVIVPNLDLGASVWEMAPRNSGSEFMVNKYRKMRDFIPDMSEEDIGACISGQCTASHGETRNACGFHRPPRDDDALLSWVAYQGVSCFPTRPVATTCPRHDSLSTAVVEIVGKEEPLFVLPVPSRGISLERYVDICRSVSLHSFAAGSCGQDSGDDRSLGSAGSWLCEHGASRLATFVRHRGGSDSCPEYWAQEGNLVFVGGR